MKESIRKIIHIVLTNDNFEIDFNYILDKINILSNALLETQTDPKLILEMNGNNPHDGLMGILGYIRLKLPTIEIILRTHNEFLLTSDQNTLTQCFSLITKLEIVQDKFEFTPLHCLPTKGSIYLSGNDYSFTDTEITMLCAYYFDKSIPVDCYMFTAQFLHLKQLLTNANIKNKGLLYWHKKQTIRPICKNCNKNCIGANGIIFKVNKVVTPFYCSDSNIKERSCKETLFCLCVSNLKD